MSNPDFWVIQGNVIERGFMPIAVFSWIFLVILAVIIAVSLVATTKYASASLVKWQVVLPVMIGAAATTWVAADWLKFLSNDILTRTFAILMIVVGIRMLFVR